LDIIEEGNNFKKNFRKHQNAPKKHSKDKEKPKDISKEKKHVIRTK
jgi:hypothetical protein